MPRLIRSVVGAAFAALAVSACGSHECSTSNPTGTCANLGDQCIAGACCSKPCAAVCCGASQTCYDDGVGNKSCATTCTTSSQCPAASPCCALLSNGGGACVNAAGNAVCRCSVGSECGTGCCAPNVDASGNPVGPLVCKANDGAAYHCCNGLTTCTGSTCCGRDANGNNTCIAPCTNDSQCGASHCRTYTLPAFSTCATKLGCGP